MRKKEFPPVERIFVDCCKPQGIPRSRIDGHRSVEQGGGDKTTLSEDEKIALDSRMMRREAILRELPD
jgi:hypothetical protein